MNAIETVDTRDIYLEKVKQLYSRGIVGIIATPVNGIIVAVFMKSHISLSILITWVSSLFSLTLVRLGIALWSKRKTLHKENAQMWGRLFIAGMVLSGILWGAGGWFLFATESIAHQSFLSFVLGGMVAGAVGTYSVLLSASLGFTIPALIPVLVRFIVVGGEMHVSMVAMVVLFMILMTITSISINKTAEECIVTGFKNRNLVKELETTNQKLNAEITEKTKTEEDLKRSEALLKETIDKRTQQLLHSQKMEAIGTLAGGVAHDFNNLLTVIKGNIELGMLRLKGDDPLYMDCQQAKDAADRATDLTRQLLLYSRKQPMNLKVMSLNDRVESLLKMLQRMIGEDVKVKTDLDPDLWMVSGDQGNIEQVMMNLAVNARDAMPTGGDLTIRTENVTVDKSYLESNEEAVEGEFVKLSIEDTGAGMSEETRGHIFEPFYTTKGYGKGTGLGMSVVYGIVKEHSGWINIYSELGKGTVFSIYLPVASTDQMRKKSDRMTAITDLRGNGELILIVEDEASVKTVVNKFLSEVNYRLLEATSVTEAFDVFNKHEREITLVFTDTILPDNTGIELIEMIRKVRPNMKVLLGSGYPGDRIRQDIIKERDYPFIQKPYDMNELLMKVKEVITRKPK